MVEKLRKAQADANKAEAQADKVINDTSTNDDPNVIGTSQSGDTKVTLKKKPPKEIIDKLLDIRTKKTKPFFDNKTQLDLNCLWISALISADEILPKKNYIKLAEEFFVKIESKYIKDTIQHSYSKDIVFLEDYAFLINLLNDLSDKTMNFKYKELAKKICNEAKSFTMAVQ